MSSRFAARLSAFAMVAALSLSGSTALAAAATLVVKGADGKFAPGAAKSWSTEGSAVVFVLNAGEDGAAIQKVLAERLSTAKISFADGKLKVEGVPQGALLEQVSGISLSGDELSDLAGLGNVVAMGVPEAGGSIRASKPTATATPRIIKDHDPGERVDAEVVEVTRGSFPEVSLKLRLKSSAKGGPLKDKLKNGKTIEVKVVMVANQGGVDFLAAASQRNLGAFYLEKGDRVVVHPTAAGDALEADFVERKK